MHQQSSQDRDNGMPAGVGRENLYNALRSDAHPRFDTVQRVLTALGVRLTIEA